MDSRTSWRNDSRWQVLAAQEANVFLHYPYGELTNRSTQQAFWQAEGIGTERHTRDRIYLHDELLSGTYLIWKPFCFCGLSTTLSHSKGICYTGSERHCCMYNFHKIRLLQRWSLSEPTCPVPRICHSSVRTVPSGTRGRPCSPCSHAQLEHGLISVAAHSTLGWHSRPHVCTPPARAVRRLSAARGGGGGGGGGGAGFYPVHRPARPAARLLARCAGRWRPHRRLLDTPRSGTALSSTDHYDICFACAVFDFVVFFVVFDIAYAVPSLCMSHNEGIFTESL